MRKCLYGSLLLLSLGLLLSGSHLQADPLIRYTIRDLGTLGGTEAFAYGINNDGDVVGLSRLPGDASTHAFLFDGRTLIDLYPLNSQHIQTSGPASINGSRQVASGAIRDNVYYPAIYDNHTGQITFLGSLGGVTPFGFSGVATGINEHGEAVGYSYLDGLNRHAFLYTGGRMIDLGSFGGYSSALDINDSSQVVGFASDTVLGVARAFIHTAGSMTEINPFNSLRNESYAQGINNKGEVVGTALNASGSAFNAFIYRDGVSTSLGTLPGGRNSGASSISDRGDIVGSADHPYSAMCEEYPSGTAVPCVRYAQRAFVYQRGAMIDLNSLIPHNSGWDLQLAFDINSRGQITGYGILNGRYRAYLMTPVKGSAR